LNVCCEILRTVDQVLFTLAVGSAAAKAVPAILGEAEAKLRASKGYFSHAGGVRHCSWRAAKRKPNILRESYNSLTTLPPIRIMNERMKTRLFILVCFVLAASLTHAFADVTPAEPGPEEGGLRLRLAVTPRTAGDTEGYEVRVDVINFSAQAVTLRARWRYDDAGDVKDYIDAATSIECVPAIAPWMGGVAVGQRKAPQPEQLLKAGEILSVHWQTEGRQLKNRVTNPNEVQNPEFPFPGLYSVHATLEVITSERTVRLRSNEQLVPVGGSRAMPKYTMGQLVEVDAEKKTAIVSLGTLHKIETGDQFEIGHPKGMHWKLTITRVEPRMSWGDLELLTRSTFPPYSNPPQPYMSAVLMRQK
jgi:hypothetical protein